EPVELVHQVGPRGCRDPGDPDDRRDPDRDAERRQQGPHAPPPEADDAEPDRIAPTEPAARHGGGRRDRLARHDGTTRPSRIRIRRSVASATGSLWVISAIVVPDR